MWQQGAVVLIGVGTLLGALMVVALLGCGGVSKKPAARTASSVSSVSAGTKTSVSSPESETVATANGICGRLNTTLRATTVRLNSAQEIATFASGRAAAEQTALSELERLRPPATVSAAWRQVIAHRAKLIDLLNRLASAAAGGQSNREGSISRAYASATALLGVAAKQAGLPECATAG